ncbi:MAG: hypothetical protein U0168_16995 [Nannocystaceae bacterium]
MALDRIVDVFPEHQQGQIRMQLSMVLRAVVTQVLLPSTRPPPRARLREASRNVAVATKIRDLRKHQIQSEIQKGRSEGMRQLRAVDGEARAPGRLAVDLAVAQAGDKHLLAELMRQG